MKRAIPILFLLLISCKQSTQKETKKADLVDSSAVEADPVKKVPELTDTEKITPLSDLNDTIFVKIADYSNDFVYDLKYATTDNFLKSQVYDCAECYLRVKTIKALLEANREFMEKGYRIKFFDCYRPHDVQKKMWKMMPNPIYVADPAEGSIHNKGGAVDITLVTLAGDELDMGTGFDYFGREAHHAYQGLDQEVLNNRKLLKETMEKYGFGSITSEWWHYNYKPTLNEAIANFKWKCD